MLENKKIRKEVIFLVVEVLIILIYLLPWVLFGLNYWISKAFAWDSMDNQYLVNISVGAFCLGTLFFLWSFGFKLGETAKKLFFLTGLMFLVFVIMFLYLSLNIVLEWNGIPSLAQAIKDAYPNIFVQYTILEQFPIIEGGFIFTLSANSMFVSFLFVLGVLFYVFSVEKYSLRKEVPWKSLSILICTILVPIMILISNIPNIQIFLIILCVVITIVVAYNLFFLFYLYFSTGLKSPKKTDLRRGSFLIGIGLLIILVAAVSKIFFFCATETPSVQSFSPITVIVRLFLAFIGIFMFNYGFYLIRPI